MIDSREDILRRAMRDGEADIPESLGLDDPGIEVAASAVESVRIGTLKAEDRLLAVAHDENRPRNFRPRTDAGKEILGQSGDDLPLFRTRILRFVDKNVIDATVELV